MSREAPHARIQQSCAIPFRRRSAGLEFCLITSLKNQNWIFPKGIVDPGETPISAALKEAYEEAGLHGQILDEPLGSYPDSKWGSDLEVTVYLMEVSSCDDEWLEGDVRKRCWVSADETRARLSQPHQREFFERACKRLEAEFSDDGGP